METALKLPPVGGPSSVLARGAVGFYPERRWPGSDERRSIAECERMLTEWFGSPVILLASGRSGLVLWLRSLGFTRYGHKLEVPLYLSRCVLNAVTTAAFPVEAGARADGLLLYHQYGFPQRCTVKGRPVLEDVAHCFFASPSTGEREWASDVALFSLRKFFGTAGMAGGLVVRNRDLEGRLRRLVSLAPDDVDHLRAWIRNVTATAFSGRAGHATSMLVDGAYELLLGLCRPTVEDLVGLPVSVRGIGEIGDARRHRIEFYRSRLGAAVCHSDFWPSGEELLPFALPFFGSGDPRELRRLVARLADLDVRTEVYHMDVRRNQLAAEYRPCVLLPCHQDVPIERLDEVCQAAKALA